MLSGISQTEKNKYKYDHTYMWNLKNKTQTHRKRSHLWLGGAERQGGWEMGSRWSNFQLPDK